MISALNRLISEEPAIKYVQLQNLLEAKEFFGPLSEAERLWRSQQSFATLIASPRAKLGIGEHDRGEAHIFGGHGYPSGDQVSLDRHFPLNVKIVSVSELAIGDDETCDFSATPEEFPWPVSPGDELYLKMDVDRLTFGMNSSLSVKGNVFVLDCGTIVGMPSSPKHCLFIQLSDNGKPVARRRLEAPMAIDKRQGDSGARGLDARPPHYEVTPFGPKVVVDAQRPAPSPGGDGEDGKNGRNGDNGGMLYLADLRFKAINCSVGSVIVSAKAGDGFPGEAGGRGGNGGCGGNGTLGLQANEQLLGASPGARGGRGGNGGVGGRGGNGGMSSDVYLSIPQKCSDRFKFNLQESSGGIGGAGGAGGVGGQGGSPSPEEALAGCHGANGPSGPKGKARAAPRAIVFENSSQT
ncbi:hypothetical protein ACFOY8_12040 [Thalassospira xianhensis]|uniref:Uncharacterized protein n=1 Tax=Thalassospira xianhensis MCCC 1A02616 TaxID=1177929 RepID=A0A367U7F5_9PROT|nr:hypothetical protein [Thalassospira xianhensis]RCK04158.1 hypothetical protein TH5_21535 [Thalassospira xianhensis MCCC 1A02616]